MSSSLSLSQLKTQGRYQEATALALRQLTAEPEAAMLHFQLACLYDVQGLEQQAIPCYLAALARDLPPAQRREAWLGLGSTYRALGEYSASLRAFDDGLAEFPQANELMLFRAMALYNLGENKRAVTDLLLLLADTSSDPDIRGYQRAIRHYAADLSLIG
ncbi:tetratricopeptide repeat protein [Serratia marcescens]|jgi:tetratricopeptide (TPR) repeat protein|uniref:tetratricopeptide repeat protein n=1 Tax=Serratia TaxID=613 RepID=UPI0003069495|nr:MULTISPECIES: tetratricopeptide repeat protein [Serratia]MBM1298726.1 tetratricopeptide repeat protein [Serratia nematodiphila]AXK25420.1 Tetratricopeptide repeat family protein [Serratia marcescens]EKX2169760.1 tetratricopeptide repeat protein [Serratia marcescens]MBH2527883.1 tetratricopeptide repeat protein [Serratia marcescens]MBH2575547.1 tetratricopeptide repeat protein [Serratia marcescens]